MRIKNKNGQDEIFLLDSPEMCLLVPPEDFRILESFSDDCLILALASCEFDPEDYIYEV